MGRSADRLAWVRVGFALLILGSIILTVFLAATFVAVWPHLNRDLQVTVLKFGLHGLLLAYALANAIPICLLVAASINHLTRKFRGVQGRPWRRTIRASLAVLLGLLATEAMIWASRRGPDGSALPTRFQPDDQKLHMTVVGGSSAMGFPYSPNATVGSIVGYEINRLNPDRKVSIELVADLGFNFGDMLQKLSSIKYKPEIMLIVAGNSEFTSHYLPERDAESFEVPTNPVLNWWYETSLGSPMLRFAYWFAHQARGEHRLLQPPDHTLIGVPWITPSERLDILRSYAEHLEVMLAYCDRIGCLPIVVLQPSNTGDFEPTRSLARPWLDVESRTEIARLYESARGIEESDPEASLAAYRDLVTLEPGFAEAHYRVGKLLQRLGCPEEAAISLRIARELDGVIARTTAEFHRMTLAVVARHPRAIPVDGAAALRALSPYGVVDDHAMIDVQHPNFRGTVALARAVLDALRQRNLYGIRKVPDDLQPAMIAQVFGINETNWLQAASFAADYHEQWASVRFDPSDRRAKSVLYRSYIDRIGRGWLPSEHQNPSEMSGLNLAPLPSTNGRMAGRDRINPEPLNGEAEGNPSMHHDAPEHAR